MTEVANADQFAAWNGDSGHRWVADADRRDRVMAPIAEAMLAAAALRPGEHVLDIGCGCGATSLASATAVAPEGRVVGIDLSAPMLGLARTRAAERGASNLTFVLGDAQGHPLPADRFAVAISRFGTMFFGDPVAAFANIAAALASGGRLCLATWQPLTANEWLTVPGAALLRYGHLPTASATPGAPGAAGMFAQSDPATVSATLHQAGFTNINLDAVTVTITLGRGAADATDYLVNTGVGRAALATIPDDQHGAALDAVRALLAERADANGVHLSAAIWLVTATRST